MPNKWIVEPEVERKDLEWNGEKFWLDLKKQLNVGEERRLATGAWRSTRATSAREDARPEIDIDWDAAPLIKILVWVADWSLSDEHNNKLKLNVDTLKALNTNAFQIIEKCVDDHAQAVRDLAKNSQTMSTPELKAISK